MKTLTFVIGLMIAAIGAVAVIAPSGLVWIAENSATSGGFYLIGAVRAAFGLLLIAAASGSRAPRTLRVLGYVVLAAGIATAVTGLVAMESARAAIEWWLRQEPGVVRLTGIPLLALGNFVAWACAPTRRAA